VGGEEGAAGAGDEGADDGGVPAGVEDADAEGGACGSALGGGFCLEGRVRKAGVEGA
jgi:hypothetical protein